MLERPGGRAGRGRGRRLAGRGWGAARGDVSTGGGRRRSGIVKPRGAVKGVRGRGVGLGRRSSGGGARLRSRRACRLGERGRVLVDGECGGRRGVAEWGLGKG